MNKISILKIIKNDYAAFLMTIAGPIFLAVSIFTAVFGVVPNIRGYETQTVDIKSAMVYCAVAIHLTYILIILLVKRIARIRDILQTGPRTMAYVTGISFIKDRGRIEFTYYYQGQNHQTGTAIMKNKQTETISVDDQIEVAIDTGKPRKVLIVSLYV